MLDKDYVFIVVATVRLKMYELSIEHAISNAVALVVSVSHHHAKRLYVTYLIFD